MIQAYAPDFLRRSASQVDLESLSSILMQGAQRPTHHTWC